MNLKTIMPGVGSNKKRFKKGRGPGSGGGKTAGRGQKGAGARKSSGQSSAFEGGQMPLQRRLPKIGMRSHFPQDTQIVNLTDLEKHCNGNVGAEELFKAGLIKDVKKPIKVLANGKLSKALQVKVQKYSAAATQAIEAAGGKAEVV
jgi:large subunit ribosomal protein L15